MPRRLSRATLAAALVLASGCASGEMGTMLSSDAPPAPVLWKFETVSWYNRYSMNSTVGPLVIGKSVLYGGTYAYQNTKASKLALVDPATGTARWRTEYGGAFGPLALTPGMIGRRGGQRARSRSGIGHPEMDRAGPAALADGGGRARAGRRR